MSDDKSKGENMNSEKRQINEGSAWRSPWVWGMLGLVAVMLSVNIFMIVMGFRTNTGLVVEDFYDRGKNYFHSEVKRLSDNERLGWQLKLEAPATPLLDANQTYRLKLSDAQGYPLGSARVMMEIFRPNDATRDFAVAMTEEGQGEYSVPVTFPLPGNWDLLITAIKGEDKMDLAQRIFVKN